MTRDRPARPQAAAAKRGERGQAGRAATAVPRFDPQSRPLAPAEQCAHLLTMAERPNIALHVVPDGTNVGLWGMFDIAAKDTMFTVRYENLEHVTGTAPETVSKAMQAFERILGAALPRADSLDFTREMESRWKTRM